MKTIFVKILFEMAMFFIMCLVIANAPWAASDLFKFSIPWDSEEFGDYGGRLNISGDGRVGTGYLLCDPSYYYDWDIECCPFRVTKEDGISEMLQSQDLDPTDYIISMADINYDGSVVVGHGACSRKGMCEYYNHILRWAEEKGWERLESDYSPDDPGETDGEATSVSDDGSTVVGVLGGDFGIPDRPGFIWKESTGFVVDLGMPAEECTGVPYHSILVSGDGQTIALACDSGLENDSQEQIIPLFKWTEQTGYRRLGHGIPIDISADGGTIVGVSSSGQAFRYSDTEGFQEIGHFAPRAANADGSIIVGDQYVWDEHNGLLNIRDYLRQKGLDVDSEELVFDSVDDISDDGLTIIGVGHETSGTSPRGWIATLDAGVNVVDNRDARFSKVGTWHASDKAAGFYGTDYVYAYGGDGSSAATFTFEVPSDGNYRIAAQWPAHSSRAPDAPFALINNGAVVDTVRVDQRIDGGGFNPLAGPGAIAPGVYALSEGVLEVTLSNDAAGKVAADAVRVVKLSDTVIVDNRDAGFSRVGTWHASDKAAGFYGTDYVYAYGGDGSSAATFTFDVPSDGNYRIAAQWPAHSSRAPDAPYTLINNGAVVDTVRVDQRIDGGRFNPLAGPGSGGGGFYTLNAGVLEVTLTNDAAGKVAADAVQVVNMGPAGD